MLRYQGDVSSPKLQHRGRAAMAKLALGVVLGVALAGCSAIANLPLIGEPDNAPKRPVEPAAFLTVHDMPPTRDDALLSKTDQDRIHAELVASRDKQKAQAAADAAAIAAAGPPVTTAKK